MRLLTILLSFIGMISLTGCAEKEPLELGYYANSLKKAQVFNPEASDQNLNVLPVASGERMETSYQTYTGKSTDTLTGSDSQILESIAD